MNGLNSLSVLDNDIQSLAQKVYTGKELDRVSAFYNEHYEAVEHELKVLQILKEKKVDLGAIYYLVFIEPPIKNTLLERYNQLVYLGKETRKVQLTEKEMKLIVEWLKGE